MSKHSKNKAPLIEEGPYRGGTSMCCHMILIMLPVIGLIYGLIKCYGAKDREMRSLCAGMIVTRAVGMIFYFLFFAFLLKVCMRTSLFF